MIFSFADKSYFAASSLLEQFCLSGENINAEFWWQWPQFSKKEPGIYLVEERTHRLVGNRAMSYSVCAYL